MFIIFACTGTHNSIITKISVPPGENFDYPHFIVARTSEHESDEELGDCIFKRKKARTGSPLMESPLLKENKRPPEPMKETTVANAKERMPSPHCSGDK